MLKRNVHRSSGELPVSAISQKSRSHANGVFRGLGILPNKQQTVRSRESGDRTVWSLCYDTGIACRLLATPQKAHRRNKNRLSAILKSRRHSAKIIEKQIEEKSTDF